MTEMDYSSTSKGSAELQNHKKIYLITAVVYSVFGYIASILSQGMKGPSGPMMAAVFIFALTAMDFVLVKSNFNFRRLCGNFFFLIEK
jgi:hypothetical protein